MVSFTNGVLYAALYFGINLLIGLVFVLPVVVLGVSLFLLPRMIAKRNPCQEPERKLHQAILDYQARFKKDNQVCGCIRKRRGGASIYAHFKSGADAWNHSARGATMEEAVRRFSAKLARSDVPERNVGAWSCPNLAICPRRKVQRPLDQFIDTGVPGFQAVTVY